MAKKLTKQEAKQDNSFQGFERVQAFYLTNRNVIIGAAIAVIVAIGLAIGYHYYKKSKNEKAEKKMGMAEEFLMKKQYKLALNGSAKNSIVGFKQIINNYPATKAGNLAHYYAAVCYYQLGNTKQALKYINNYNPPDGILGVAPLSFKGVVQVQAGNYLKGAKTYVQAAEWDKNNSTTPYNYLKAAEAYQSAGKPDHARKYANIVINDYPNSSQVTEAQKLLGRLEVGGGGAQK